MDYELIVQMLAAKYGISPSEALAILGTLMFGFRVLGKLIPDDKKGVAGFIRKASKILGAYVANRQKSQDESFAENESLTLREQYERTMPQEPQGFFARDSRGRFVGRGADMNIGE